jgi:hypothetical protein
MKDTQYDNYFNFFAIIIVLTPIVMIRLRWWPGYFIDANTSRWSQNRTALDII